MSRRVTRSMTASDQPESNCTLQDSSTAEFKTGNIDADALGLFGVLPTEIIEEILSYLSVKNISKLALASSEWRYFLKVWLERTRTIYRVSREITTTNFEDHLRDLADLIRRVSISSTPVDLNVLVRYAKDFLERLELLWVDPYKNLLTLGLFGFFLRRCLKRPAEEKSVPPLCLFEPYPRFVRSDEISRNCFHQLFDNEPLKLAAVDFSTKGYDIYSKADFAIQLFAPTDGETENSLKENIFRDYSLLAAVLNKWWKDNEKEAVSITKIILIRPEPMGHYRIADLLAKLDVDFAASVLDDPDKIQRVLPAMAEINGEAMLRLLESVRKTMTNVDSNAVVRYVHHVVQKEISVATKRCRRSFSPDLSDGPFKLLHNLEIVLKATAKILEEIRDTPDSPESKLE